VRRLKEAPVSWFAHEISVSGVSLDDPRMFLKVFWATKRGFRGRNIQRWDDGEGLAYEVSLLQPDGAGWCERESQGWCITAPALFAVQEAMPAPGAVRAFMP